MQDGPSTFSLIAAAFYGLVVVASLSAGRTARIHHQRSWHLIGWLAISAVLGLLAVSRILNFEEVMRVDLRAWLIAEELRQDRRAYQGVIISIVIALFVASALLSAYWVSRRISGHRNIAVAIAGASCVFMLILILLRVVSLHALDALLFGPLKLNWFGDLGAATIILGSAIYYTLRVKRGP